MQYYYLSMSRTGPIAGANSTISEDLVTNIRVTSLMPDFGKDNAAYKSMLPDINIPHRIEFTLNGVNNAVANAIRRTVMCELPVRYFHCDYDDIKTNDPFIIAEMIQKRLRMLPITQSVNVNNKYSLDVTNNTMDTLDVKASQIKGGPQVVNSTFTVLTLQPGKYIKIRNIRIESEFGFRDGYGMLALGVNAASTAVGVEPYNAYENTGVHSHVADPRNWKISFNTNGTMPPRAIVAAACHNIIERLNNIKNLLYSIESRDELYIFTVHGETHTIANLLMKTICDMHSDIGAVTYKVMPDERAFRLTIRTDMDVSQLIIGVVNACVKIFNDIAAKFQ